MIHRVLLSDLRRDEMQDNKHGVVLVAGVRAGRESGLQTVQQGGKQPQNRRAVIWRERQVRKGNACAMQQQETQSKKKEMEIKQMKIVVQVKLKQFKKKKKRERENRTECVREKERYDSPTISALPVVGQDDDSKDDREKKN